VSEEMRALHKYSIENDLLFLNECGLDPGIDHMSAMKIIDSIRANDGSLISFESFTGGLISPETDKENPWRYKFTWNPRNVVMAGQGTAKFLENDSYKYIPYQQLFKRTTQISIPGHGIFEGYANRDSLKYQEVYGLKNLKTMIRGTLRNEGFCSAWNILVQLGCCDDSFKMEDVGTMTHREFMNSFLPYHTSDSVEEKIQKQFNLSKGCHEMDCLTWSGFFDNVIIGLSEGSPAQILEFILNKKWSLRTEDKDMIVMWHRFRYHQDGREKFLEAYLVVKGEDNIETAMAKTVGLPLGIATKNLLLGKIKSRGVVIPVASELYTPILEELEQIGIRMIEQDG
jgi:saccharopine dehydrogenase (NADP+, L-glutamate forming)